MVSASGSPSWVRSPPQATYPSGRINTAMGGGRAEYWELPLPHVARVDQPDPVCPRSHVEAAEVQQHRPGVVQQFEDTHQAFGGAEVEVGHPASEQRMCVPRS